jgi:hypothetical protein
VSNNNKQKLNIPENTHIIFAARDPHTLYIYWEVPVTIRIDFMSKYGEDAWNNSTFAIKIINVTKNESYYIKIHNFSDNMYISSIDESSTYFSEIGRMGSDGIFISMGKSNLITTPSESLSNAVTSDFFDYKRVRDGTNAPEYETDITTQNFDFYSNIMFGISSPGFYEIRANNSAIDVGPQEKVKNAIYSYLGISSNSLIR